MAKLKTVKVGNTTFKRGAKQKASIRSRARIIRRAMFGRLSDVGSLWSKNKSGKRTG